MKASVSKKTLSVFLSVLMMLSCFTTAIPLLSDLFGDMLGVTAEAGTITSSQWTTLDNALNTWAGTSNNTYQRRNSLFHVVEALQAVLNTYVETSNGNATLNCSKTGSVTWSNLVTGGNFLADIRSVLAERYTSGSTKYNLLANYYPAAKTEDQYDSDNTYTTTNRWWGSQLASQPGDPLDSAGTETFDISRNAKDCLYEYSSVSEIPNTVNTKFTITYDMGKRTDTAQNGQLANYYYKARGSYYYFGSKPSGSYTATNIANTYKKDIVDYTTHFSLATIAQDPFAAFTDLAQAQAAVDANNAAYTAFWSTSGRWSSSDTSDLALLNQYMGSALTTVAGDTYTGVAYTNAVDTYMAACVDALKYYTAKPYAELIGQYSLASGQFTLDRDRLSYTLDPVTHAVTKAFDLTYLTRTQAYTYYTNIGTWLTAIETLYGTVDGNVTDDTASKGLKKLYTVDGYYHSDVVALRQLLKDYYMYYDLVALKLAIDTAISDYQIPTTASVDFSQGSYKYRDNDPNSATYVEDAQIDYLFGEFSGWVHTLTDDDIYSGSLKYYVFGDANYGGYYNGATVGYVEVACDRVKDEVERRDFICELAPFISHFMPLIYMDLTSLTATQIQSRITDDQAIYQTVYDYRDENNNPVVFAHPQYDERGLQVIQNGQYVTYNPYSSSYPYNYINVYNLYRTENPAPNLSRQVMLECLGNFNEDVQLYIYRLYQRLANILAERVTLATDVIMTRNASNQRVPAEITLDNFALIKKAVENVRNFYTTSFTVPGTDDEGNPIQQPILVYDYLQNYAYMMKQNHKDANGYYDDNFVNTQLSFFNGLNLTMADGFTESFATAYNRIMTGDFIDRYNAFVNSGGLNNWSQEHYYNTSDGSAAAGYKFSKPEAYMVRAPYYNDLGRGNDTVANDTYTVTNKMVENLVTQLDTFLGSQDMVAILSSFIKDGEDSILIKDISLSEYVMKLLGEKLFTDKLINTLVQLVFPLITGKLEELWSGLDGASFTSGCGKLHTVTDDAWSIYMIANHLGLWIYPEQLANNCLTNPQLANAKQRILQCRGSASKYHEADLWTNVINANLDEDEKLVLDWGVDSIEKGANETYNQWFIRRSNAFKIALTGVLSGIEDLVLALFANKTYSQTKKLDNVIKYGIFNADIKELTIKGMKGYSRFLVPILETLGCADGDILTEGQAVYSSQLGNTGAVVNAILNPIINLVTNQVAVKPIETVLNLLPNLLYFLSFGTIDTLLKTIDLHFNAKLYDIKLYTILGVANFFGASLPIKRDSSAEDCYINLYEILGINSINEKIEAVDITDINDIIALVLKSVLGEQGDLELPTVNVGSVLRRTVLHRSYSTKAVGYTRNWFETDKADMFYELISWVGRAFQNDSFVNQLVALITKSNQQQDTLVRELLTGVKNSGPAHFVMGLVEVFQPKARAGVSSTSVWANTTYMPAQYTWYGSDSAQNGMANKPISRFLYVAYQNDWTYVKANTFVENADTIISKLLESQLKEREVNSFGEWLLSLINLAWSNEAITTVMRLLVTLGNATKNELITYIIGRFTEYGMDLSEWYKAFGYLFPDIVEEEVETGEVDGEGNPVTVKQMPESLIPGHTGYTNVFGNLTAAVDPEYEEDLNESGVDRNRNKKYIWTYNGTALELGDRQTFQSILSYMLAGGSGTKGGMMPAIDIFLSGDTGYLFKQPNGTSLLKIYGSNGYDSALVPFFETLGMNELLDESDFVGFATSVGLAANQFVHGKHMLTQREFDSISNEQKKVEYLFNVAFGFLEKMMEPEYTEKLNDDGTVVLDEETGEPVMVPVYNKLVKNILATVVPSTLYFLQSNGLSVMVRNLLQPVLTLVDALLPVFNMNIDDGTSLAPATPLDDLLNELIGRFVLPLLGKAGDRQIATDGQGNYLYETDGEGNPLKDADGNVIYIYDDDYGVSLKDLSLHRLMGVVEKLTGLNMEPFVYGLDAICSTVMDRSHFIDSASESSTDAFWTTTGARNTFKKPVFLDGAYYDIVAGVNGAPPTTVGAARDVNDPANVVTILLSLVLDLVLEEHSKSPVRTPVTDNEGNPVYIVDQNGNTTTMIRYTYTTVNGQQKYYTNAEAVVNLISLFTDAELINLIPMVIGAVRDLGFTTAWTITPNWSYFDDLDRADYDPDTGEIIRTNRRTTAQLIAEASASANGMINTPVRTIYYLRYAENFAPSTNLWSRELATYLDTSLSDLADWIIGDFVAKDGSTLGQYLENLLTGEGGLIKKGIINTINAALRDGIGNAVAKFAELLNIFLSFDINFWNEDPYPEEEEDDPLTLAQFGADLARLFTPLNEVLTWLLAGDDMAFFHSYRTTGGYTEYVMSEADRAEDYGDLKDLIVLPGGQGYWVALVPLLEMLGIQLPRNADDTGYKYLRESEGANAGRIYYMNGDTKVYASGIEILTDVVVAVLSQVEGWMRGEDPMGLGDNLIDCVLNRLANVFYFLNANGLVSVVVNLLSPLVPLANALVPMIFSDLNVPAQQEGEELEAYETRKFIVLIDELLDSLLYTETTTTQLDPETGVEVDVVVKTPLLPESFSIVDMNLYNIFEVIKDITGLDINGAVTADFYINGENGDDGIAYSYNYLRSFFLGDISMRASANGDMYFRMDFNDEESRADFITILLYTVMDVLNSAMTPGTSNNEFFVKILGKTDEEDEEGNAIIDEALGQRKLQDLYNIIHARVNGYEGYDWFYFDKDAREAYYARTPETEYSATLQLKIQSILEQLASGGYVVDPADTTMAYLLTGYLNYTDTNLWDENTALMVETRFNEIVDLIIHAVAGDDATVGGYLTGLLEGLDLYTNRYIVMIGSLLGNLLSGIPENVIELLNAAVPGFNASYWNQYAGKAVEDDEHPAGTYETDEETGDVTKEYVPLVYYSSKTAFVNEFVGLFEPFGYLLDWLLVGEHKGLELFYVVDGQANDTPAISIGGANGFKEGLVPLLEALGLKFNADQVNDPELTGIDCVKLTLNSLLNWVDALLEAEDDQGNNNTVGAFIDLLPNIIYFINANGLTVTVLNTLRSLTNILELASGLISTGDNDITNLNTLLGLDKKGIDLYDLSLEGICNIVKGLTGTDEYSGLDIIRAVSIPEPKQVPVVDEEGHPVTDEEGFPVMQTVYEYNSYLKQWAIGKVVVNEESALTDRVTYKMEFTGAPMEKINILTILVCSAIDVFKYEGNQDILRKWLGDYYDLVETILNLTAGEIHYEPYDWFYFSDEINKTNAETYFPADGDEYVVEYLDTTAHSLVYKYGYFEYYRHAAGETGNLWNQNSVGYLKDNFYNLIDTVIQLVTKYDEETGEGYATAGAFIANAWNGVNLYSKANLYSVGYTIGNLLGNFSDVLELALGILLGVDMHANWDEYMLHRVTDDAALVGTQVTDDEGHVVMYKDVAVTYIANASMDRTAFINALVDIFSPADFLLSWFLVGADTPLEFMYDKYGAAAISLNGGNGYDEALVPLLEALGCDLTDSAAYFANNGGKTGLNVVKYVADKLLGRVDDIANAQNPVQEIVAMLPELIYFINANGLSVSVRNFIAPVVSLLGVVNSFVDTGDIGEIETVDDLLAFAMNMLKDKVDVDFDLTAITISDLSITGVFNLLKAILGIDVNAAMTFPRMTNDEHGNTVVYYNEDNEIELINIYEQLAIGKVTRFTSANGRTAYRMDATDDPAALSQIDMIAILMATAVNIFEAKEDDDTYTNKAAFVKLFGENGESIFDAIINLLNLENGKYVDYDWLFTLRTADRHLPYIDPTYRDAYVSPIDKMSAISGTAGYDRYWTKEMAQYVADNLIKVVNNVLLLIGISIPGVDGPIESIEGLINSFIPGGNLYTNELLAKLTGLIAGTGEIGDDGKEDTGLMGKLDEIDKQGAIQGLLKNVLGVDLDLVKAYKGRTNFGFTDGDRNGFVSALAQFLSPVNPLLEWLFTDKSISLFYNYDASDLIKLPGGNGYEQAVIPLFEAVIGYNNPNIKTLAEYKADILANPNNMLIDILNPLLDFVDAALQDPLNVILGRLPAIIYFINSKAADRMVRNLLSPVYQVLNALNTLVDVDIDSLIKGAIGFSLEELDFNAIIEVVIGLLPDNLSSLSPLIVDAVKEYTIGKVVQYPSHATFYTDKGATYNYGFTMELDKSSASTSTGGTNVNGSQNATLADLITVLLRAVLKWVTMPENQGTVVEFLNKNIENEAVRTYVLNAYGVNEKTLGNINTGLIGFRYQPYGVSQMMGLMYYVYFAVNFASAEAINMVRTYGNYWPYVSKVLTSAVASNSALAFLSTFITYLDGLVERVNGSSGGSGSGYTPTTEDNDSGAGSSITDVISGDNGGNLNFFQKIIKWFQDLFAKIRKLFGG